MKKVIWSIFKLVGIVQLIIVIFLFTFLFINISTDGVNEKIETRDIVQLIIIDLSLLVLIATSYTRKVQAKISLILWSIYVILTVGILINEIIDSSNIFYNFFFIQAITAILGGIGTYQLKRMPKKNNSNEITKEDILNPW